MKMYFWFPGSLEGKVCKEMLYLLYDIYDFAMFYSFSVYKKKAENVRF